MGVNGNTPDRIRLGQRSNPGRGQHQTNYRPNRLGMLGHKARSSMSRTAAVESGTLWGRVIDLVDWSAQVVRFHTRPHQHNACG